MGLTSLKEILEPLSSASDAMSDALQNAQEELSTGAKRSLKSAKTSGERARRAWYERAELVRNRTEAASDQAAAKYRNAIDALSTTWTRAVKALRAAGDQAADLDVKVRKDAVRYSQQSTSWAKQNPHIVAAAVAVAGFMIIRSYRKRKQRRLEALSDETTPDIGNAANDETVHTKRSA